MKHRARKQSHAGPGRHPFFCSCRLYSAPEVTSEGSRRGVALVPEALQERRANVRQGGPRRRFARAMSSDVFSKSSHRKSFNIAQ